MPLVDTARTKRCFKASGLEGMEEWDGAQEELVCSPGQTLLPVFTALQW